MLALILLVILSISLWACIFRSHALIRSRAPRNVVVKEFDRISSLGRLGPVLGIIGTSYEMSCAFGSGLDAAGAAVLLSGALMITTAGCVILGVSAGAHMVLEVYADKRQQTEDTAIPAHPEAAVTVLGPVRQPSTVQP